MGFLVFSGGLSGVILDFISKQFILVINSSLKLVKNNPTKSFLSYHPIYICFLIIHLFRMKENKLLTEKAASEYFQISERTTG